MKKGFFSGDYVVESRRANIFGAQLFRYILSYVCLACRRFIYSENLTPKDRVSRRDGICWIPEFLDLKAVKLVESEFNKQLKGAGGSFTDGSTLVKRSTIQNLDTVANASQYIIKNPKVIDLVQNALGRRYDVCDVWFDIVVSGDPSIGDSQRVMHTDNFYSTYKMWYFLDDVTLAHGPLVFATGTSRFSFIRAIFEYVNSISYAAKNASWRPSKTWQKLLSLHPKEITVPANSFVIADTHGFHRRGDAVAGMERRQIHFRMRTNPLKKCFSLMERLANPQLCPLL